MIMADLTLINTIRRTIGDNPQFEFNQTTSDGSNSSWRLTNAPIEEGSESIFVSGIIMQTAIAQGSLASAVTTADYTLTLDDASLYTINERVALDDAINPVKYYITDITGNVLTLNRKLAYNYAAGTQVYKITPVNYSIDYQYGILYFTVTYDTGAVLGCNFRYYQHLNSELEDLYNDATLQAQRDADENVGQDIILLKLRLMALESALTSEAGGAIKIKQGSTSLDLTGATQMINRQIEQAENTYRKAVREYLWSQLEGGAAVGRSEYLD